MKAATQERPHNGRYAAWLWLLAMTGLLTPLSFVHLLTGAQSVTANTVLDAVFSFNPESFQHQVVVNMRAPRLCAALLCGSSLAVSGFLLQSLLRNPLAEPHILGFNSGASLTIVAFTALPAAFHPTEFGRPLLAALGGGLWFFVVFAMASAGRAGLTVTKFIFCGVAFSALASALVSAILILDQNTMEEVRLWLVGDLASVSRADVASALPVAVTAFIAAILISPRLDAMVLGDASAIGLGVAVRQTRLIGICASAALAGAAVSVSGPIGFIGLIVPGIARKLARGAHVSALSLAAVIGAMLLISADIASRTLLPSHELATGITTALAGVPVFLFLVARTVR